MQPKKRRYPTWIFCLTLAILLPACRDEGSGGANPPDHAPHGPASGTDTITVWGQEHEVFIEHPFLVRGKAATFVTHVTRLDGYQPRQTGSITFLLKSGAQTHEVVAQEPKRDGLYTPQVTFPTSGEWEVEVRIAEQQQFYDIALPTRWVFDSQEEADLVIPPEGDGGVQFLKEQQWSLRFGTAPVQRRPLTERVQLPGVVSARARARALVHPAVAGQLAAHEDRPLPATGERVVEGQILAVVQPPVTSDEILSLASNRQATLALRQQIEAMAFERKTLEAELRVKLAETEAREIASRVTLEHARENLERTRDLHSRNARTDVQLAQTQQRVEAAQAELDSAAALKDAYEKTIGDLESLLATGPAPEPPDVIELPTFRLVAPISGTVVSVDAVLGQHVLPEDHIFMVLDAGRVLIRARVPESELARIGESPGALYERPDGQGEFRSIAGAGGRFVHIGLEVDPRTRTVDLVYEVPNDGSLRIGMALNLLVETSTAQDSLTVPRSALVSESGLDIVFVMTGGETFEKRYVETGIEDGPLVEIRSGLSEGDRVVTEGAYAVRLASASTSIPAHGHAH